MIKIITIASLIATAGFASAATTYIDFGNAGGTTGVVDGNTWNTVSGSTSTALSNTLGNPAGNIVVTPLTAMSLNAIPEPSSAALLGLGGLTSILRRRK